MGGRRRGWERGREDRKEQWREEESVRRKKKGGCEEMRERKRGLSEGGREGAERENWGKRYSYLQHEGGGEAQVNNQAVPDGPLNSVTYNKGQSIQSVGLGYLGRRHKEMPNGQL